MNEIINSILEAESRAAETVKAASEAAKKSILDGEEAAEALKEQAVSDFKQSRKQHIANAEARAESEYKAKIADGEKAAERLTESCKTKIGEVADFVVGRLID